MPEDQLTLYLLRHAPAEERSTLYPDDSLRPLSAQGRKKMLLNAKGIKSLGLSVDVIISSPYLRAKDTATIALSSFKNTSKKISFSAHLTPESSLDKLLRELNTSYKNCKSILLVGHEPQLSSLVELLLKKPFHVAFKKGGLCQLTLPMPLQPKRATFNWMKTPSELRQINKTSRIT